MVCALALASLGAFSAAHACDSEGQNDRDDPDAEGGHLRCERNLPGDIKKEEIDTSKPILECLDPVAGDSADSRTALEWVSLLEVKVAGKTARKCQDQAISRVADTTTRPPRY